MEGSRSAYFEQLKFALICLVVIVHAFGYHVEQNLNLGALLVFINTFFMPLFAFVSGLFHSDNHISKRFILLITYGLYFKALEWLIGSLTQHVWGGFSLFKETTIAWYIFALALWEGFSYLVRKVNPKFVLAGAVIIGSLAGYDAMVTGSYFFSRVIVFFPFFYMGVIADKEKVLTFIKGKKSARLTALKFTCMILMFLYAVICVVCRNKIWDLASLVVPTTLLTEMPFKANILTRFAYYAGVVVIAIGFMAIIPQKEIGRGIFAKWGQRTLQVYIYHIFIRDIFDKNGWAEWLCSSTYRIFLYIILNVLFAIILSQKVFSIPTDYIKNNLFKKNQEV